MAGTVKQKQSSHAIEAEPARAFMGTPVPERILTLYRLSSRGRRPTSDPRRSCACTEAPVAEEPLRWAHYMPNPECQTKFVLPRHNFNPILPTPSNPDQSVSCCIIRLSARTHAPFDLPLEALYTAVSAMPSCAGRLAQQNQPARNRGGMHWIRFRPLRQTCAKSQFRSL